MQQDRGEETWTVPGAGNAFRIWSSSTTARRSSLRSAWRAQLFSEG
jgi:hypothetical protein